jgi:hypothetical protein
VLPDNRLVLTASSVQAAGPAAMLLMGASGGGAGAPPGTGLPDFEALGAGLLKAFAGGGETPPAKKPSNKLADITDRLVGRPTSGAAGKPAEDKSGASTVMRETYILIAAAAFEKLPSRPRAMFAGLPAVQAEPGAAATLLPRTIAVGGAAAVEFAKVAGPAGVSVDRRTGELTYTPRLTELGTHPVVLRVKDSAGGEDRIAFDVHVRLTETTLRLPPARRGTPRTLELPAIAGDGRTLVCTDGTRRTLFAFAVDAAGVVAPLASVSTDERIEAIARHGDKIAVALDGRADVLLLDPRTLDTVGRAAVGTAARHLASTGTHLFISGPDPNGRGWKTIAFDTGVGRADGEPIPLGGRLTRMPDGRTLAVGGSWQMPDVVLWDLIDRRIVDTISPVRSVGRFLPTCRSAGADPGTAGCRGGVAVHPNLPLAVLWGEAVERPAVAAAGAPPTARPTATRITAKLEAEAETVRPKVLAVVSTGSGRTIRRFELPLPGRLIDVQFTADGDTLLVIGPDRVHRLPLGPQAIVGETGPAFVSDAPPSADAERSWTYRPCVLPKPTEVKLTIEAGPAGMRLSEDGMSITWTPEPTDIGVHGVRLRAAPADGRFVDQSFNVEVRPAATPVAETRGAWLCDPAGEYLIRRIDQKLEIRPAARDGVMRTIELGDTAGAAAVRGKTLAVVLSGSGRVALVDLESARVIGQVTLDYGKARSPAWAPSGELLAATDKGEVRRIDAESFTDLGRVAHGSVIAFDARGGRLFTAVARDALPAELIADLTKLFSADVAAAGGTKGKGSLSPDGRGGITNWREIRASSHYLLSYLWTGEAVTLLDAAPISGLPTSMMIADRGRSLYLVSDGGIAVRPAGDLAAPARPITIEGDRPGETSVVGVGESAVAVSRIGRLFRLTGVNGARAAEPIDIAGWQAVPSDAYPRPEVRVAAASEAGRVVIIVGDRAYRVPVSVSGNGEHSGPVFGGAPSLLYRTGETYRCYPEVSPSEGVKVTLRTGPAGAKLADDGHELSWPVPRGHVELERVVLVARDSDGRETRQAFILRRERK